MFRVYIKLPDGSMQDRLVTASMRDAEAHYSELCKRRTPGPAVAVYHPPVPELGERRFRLDLDYPDGQRRQ